MRQTTRSLALILALVPALASSQTGRLLPALETFVAVADRAFTGRIVKVVRSEFRNAAEGPDHRPSLPADFRLFRYILSVRVEEDIQGWGPDTVVLQFEVQSDSPYYRKWIDEERSFLWSVGPADPARWGSLVYKTRQNTPDQGSLRWLVLDLDGKGKTDDSSQGRFRLPLFGEDLRAVRTRKEALARLEAFARAHPQPLPVIDAPVPSDLARRNGIDPNAYLIVAFPDDPIAKAAIRRHAGHP